MASMMMMMTTMMARSWCALCVRTLYVHDYNECSACLCFLQVHARNGIPATFYEDGYLIVYKRRDNGMSLHGVTDLRLPNAAAGAAVATGNTALRVS